MSKPQIPSSEVEKAQAIAGFSAGQKARSKGYDAGVVRAMASFGKETQIGELSLKPQGLQVQLCLIEHAALFEGHLPADGSLGAGLKRLTHLALIFADPDRAFEMLTDHTIEETSRRAEFSAEAFDLAKHFQAPEAIEKLTAHIAVQMGLLSDSSPEPLAEPKKSPRRATPARSKR